MNKHIILFFFTVLFSATYAQKSSFLYFRTIDYYNNQDSTKNYGITYIPNQPASKLLILLPGFGESPQMAEIETDIPEVAAKMGIVTVILSNNEGNLSFQIDQSAQGYLDTIIPFLLQKYHIPNNAYYIGGFSLGGSGAIKYAQHCYTYDIAIAPRAVFAIDPPLDFLRLYNVYDKWLDDTATFYNSKLVYITMLEKMRTYFRGDLNTAYDNYVQLSPYCYEDKNKFGVRLFNKTPIRIFCEPDFEWAINEKHWNAYDLNVIDNVSFINELQRLGNKDASITLTENKGYRKILKMKHPHSWSIADANATVKWLLKY